MPIFCWLDIDVKRILIYFAQVEARVHIVTKVDEDLPKVINTNNASFTYLIGYFFFGNQLRLLLLNFLFYNSWCEFVCIDRLILH